MIFSEYLKRIVAKSTAIFRFKDAVITTKELMQITKADTDAETGEFRVALLANFSLEWLFTYFYCLFNNMPLLIINKGTDPVTVAHYLNTLKITHFVTDLNSMSIEYFRRRTEVVWFIQMQNVIGQLNEYVGVIDPSFTTPRIYHFTAGISTFRKCIAVTGSNIEHAVNKSDYIPNVSNAATARHFSADPVRYHVLALLTGLTTNQVTQFDSNMRTIVNRPGIIFSESNAFNKMIAAIISYIISRNTLLWHIAKNEKTWLGKLLIRAWFSAKQTPYMIVLLGPAPSKSVRKYLKHTLIYNMYGMAETNYLTALYDDRGSILKMYTPFILSKEEGNVLVGGNGLCRYANDELNMLSIDKDNYLHTDDYGIILKGNLHILGKHPMFEKIGITLLNSTLEQQIASIPFIKEAQFLHRNGACYLLIYPNIEEAENKNLTYQDLQHLYDIQVMKLNRALPENSQISKAVIYTKEFEKTINGEIRRFLYND